MKKVDRYLYQVRRYLNSRNKDDIIEELRSTILDEFEAAKAESDRTEDELINDILSGFGHPRNVAAEYSGQGTLIPKPLVPIFWMVVKIVAIVVFAAGILGSTIEYFNSAGANDFASFLLHMLEAMAGIGVSVLSTVGIIFLSFHLMKHTITDEALEKLNVFDPEKLPKVPESEYKLKMVDAFFEIVGSAVLLYVLNYQQGVFSIYQGGTSMPFLNESFDAFLRFINISLIARMFITLAHVIMNRKTFVTKTLEFILVLYSATILIALAFSDVLNQDLIDQYDIDFLPTLFMAALIFAAVVSLIVGVVDYIKAVMHLPKSESIAGDGFGPSE